MLIAPRSLKLLASTSMERRFEIEYGIKTRRFENIKVPRIGCDCSPCLKYRAVWRFQRRLRFANKQTPHKISSEVENNFSCTASFCALRSLPLSPTTVAWERWWHFQREYEPFVVFNIQNQSHLSFLRIFIPSLSRQCLH
jgi:hypothetical protein